VPSVHAQRIGVRVDALSGRVDLEQRVDLLRVAARHPRDGVVLAHGLRTGRLQQAIDLTVVIVLDLDVTDPERVVGLGLRLTMQLPDCFRGQLQIGVEVHEPWHTRCAPFR
jgi:hypothetical protein